MYVIIRITPSKPFESNFTSNDPTGIYNVSEIKKIITQVDPDASVIKITTARYENDPYENGGENAVHAFAHLSYNDEYDEDCLCTLPENETHIVDFTKVDYGKKEHLYSWTLRKYTDAGNPLKGSSHSMTTYFAKEGMSMADAMKAEYLAIHGTLPEEFDDDIESQLDKISTTPPEYFRDAYVEMVYI